MKRRYIAPAVGLVVAAQFQREHENAECTEPPCADERYATMPEPSHAHEDFPEYEIVGDELLVMNTSPVSSYTVGTPEFFRFVAENRIDLDSIGKRSRIV